MGRGAAHDGHVARNLRLCLAMTDMVEPYVAWAADGDGGAALGFDVGGALHVDAATLHTMPAGEGPCPTAIADLAQFAQQDTATHADVEAHQPAIA